MPFQAKALVPAGNDPQAAHPVFDQAVRDKVTLLTAPEDYLLTEGLAATLSRAELHPLWLRLGPQDRDPGAFLASLVAAAQRSRGDVARATLDLMRARPGPVYGWQPLFAQLATDLSARLAAHGALVLENVHHIWAGTGTFALFSSELLPRLASRAPCVLLASRGPPRGALGGCTLRSGPELRAPASAVLEVLDECVPALPRRARDRAAALIAGHPAVLAGLRAAGGVADRGDLARVLTRVRCDGELLTRLAQMLLTDADRDERRTLGLALRTKYAHPAAAWAARSEGALPEGPWWQALEDGWTRIRTCWSRPLQVALGRQAMPGRETLRRAADWLLQANGSEYAIPLYLELGDHECAARAIAGQAEILMDLGQWLTMERWLSQLPARVLAAYPVLSYARADMAAARNDPGTAQRLFDMAAQQFAAQSNVDGACRSMLGASTAAANAGDLAAARARARAAGSVADEASLTGLRMWAAWQEGRAALVAGDTDGALALFARAAATSSPDGSAEPILVAGQIATRVEDLRQQRKSCRQAEATLSDAEHQALNELVMSVRLADRRADGLPGVDGWSRAPAPLKLPGLSEAAKSRGTSRRRSWTRLRLALLRDRDSGDRYPSQNGYGVSGPPRPEPPIGPGSLIAPSLHAARGSAVSGVGVTAARPVPLIDRRTRGTGPELAVHLLGPLCVTVSDVPAEDWSSARCRSLFGYLVTHRQPWPLREVLMDVFWPESSPEASRNSLNVAMHGLRRVLRTATEFPVIVYSGGAYRIHPEIRIWLDIDEFDARVRQGRQADAAGDPGRAMENYEFADNLYRGDFLADDPYEDWATVTRERLRLAHLDVLGRLSSLHFALGRYAACATVCQRIIERDPCREDAHRRLMRCYSRQGQPHLALLQYRACVRALAQELGVEAGPATVELQEKIRRHDLV